jgi:hypothetical protein
MKGVVQPAPDFQMFVGRGQVQKEGLPYLLALPPPRGRAFSFPVVTRGGKDFFPSGYRGKIDKTGTERTLKHQGVSMPLERPFVYVFKIPSIQIFEC